MGFSALAATSRQEMLELSEHSFKLSDRKLESIGGDVSASETLPLE